jgi:prepilin-type N-terminal cleavage/methylation domain-containing protein
MNDLRRRVLTQHGYTLVETMMVLGVIGILSAMAVVQVGTSRNGAKGDAAMRVVLSQMNQAREIAITQRRYVRVTFDAAANQVCIVREDTTSTTTTLALVPFEGAVKFSLITGLPDTPDAFGKTTATTFTSSSGTFASACGSTSVAKFTPDGTLVDWNGRTANGSVFLAIPNIGESARAVTVLGSTGRVRGYRWNGTTWKVV